MEPVVVRCNGCGAQIRVAKPAAALDRSCPRCGTPLIAVLGPALAATEPRREPPAPVRSRARSSRLWLGAAMALAVVVPPLAVLMRHPAEPLPSGSTTAATTRTPRTHALCPKRRERADSVACEPQPEPRTQPSIVSEPEESNPERTSLSAKAVPPPDVKTSIALALAEGPGDAAEARPEPSVYERSPRPTPRIPPPRPEDAERTENPSPDAPKAPTAEPAPASRRSQSKPVPLVSLTRVDASNATRIRVRNSRRDVVVGRVYGQTPDGKTSVLLPDGEIGFTAGMAETDEPFRPLTFDQLREQLTSSGPFSRFHVRQSAHYLVLYESTTPFAEASIKLLEDLYRYLTAAFSTRKIKIHEAEFPLVAIIFRTERDFRAHKQVAPEVQAYYEIQSNRIYFYQTSERDQQSPEMAALRKPQTVAHEGTHQILQNIGIHPRLSDWPLWLVEGLAEYCSPATMTRKGASWGGLGLVNPMHMATINDLEDPASEVVQGAGHPRLGRDRRTPLVEYLVTRSDLTPTDYALSWALTHYLAMRRGAEFLAFLKTMSQLPPLEKRSPEEHLASFRAAFGPDLVKMDRAIATHLSKLKYTPLPYYAVVYEQPIGRGQIRRATMVSQSPSVINQWLEAMRQPNGGPPVWDISHHPTRARALFATQQWLGGR